MIRFDCQCGQHIEVPAKHAGKHVKCKSCGQVWRVPEPTAAAPPPARPAAPAAHTARPQQAPRSQQAPRPQHVSPTQHTARSQQAGPAAAPYGQPPQQPPPFRRNRRKVKHHPAIVAVFIGILFVGFTALVIFLVQYRNEMAAIENRELAVSTPPPRKPLGPLKLTPTGKPAPIAPADADAPAPAPLTAPLTATPQVSDGGDIVTIAGTTFRISGSSSAPVAPAGTAAPPPAGIISQFDPASRKTVCRTKPSRLTVNEGKGARTLSLYAVYDGDDLTMAQKFACTIHVVVAGAAWQDLPASAGAEDMALFVIMDGKEIDLPLENKESAADLDGKPAQRLAYTAEVDFLPLVAKAGTVQLKIRDDLYSLNSQQITSFKQFAAYLQGGEAPATPPSDTPVPPTVTTPPAKEPAP